MNLKESYRYQNFLSHLLDAAAASIRDRDHATITTRTHLRSKVNPTAPDVVETVQPADTFSPNDQIITFLHWLITEREKLSTAISAAKSSLDFNIDAAIEANKFRQTTIAAIRSMLRYTPGESTTQGRDYKFNNEGNQMPYYYDIEVKTELNYSLAEAKESVRILTTMADETSARIDAALVNTTVDYTPPFNVNDTFEDVMQMFAALPV